MLGRPALFLPAPTPNHSLMLFLESPSMLDWALLA